MLGNVTLAGLYAYLAESFDEWQQQPTFKANLDKMFPLRECAPAVERKELGRLPKIFIDDAAELPLDPSYEPTFEFHDPERVAIFGILQRCRAARLVEPVGAAHMYDAALTGKSCRLPPLGRHYWRMAKQNRV